MSAVKVVMGGYEITSTPMVLPDGKFVARAVVTRQADHQVHELWPDFEAFSTEAEASSAKPTGPQRLWHARAMREEWRRHRQCSGPGRAQ